MKFAIFRRSRGRTADPGLVGSCLMPLTMKETVLCDLDEHSLREWLSAGLGHQVRSGYLSRFIHIPGYAVNLKSLDDLAKIVQEHGPITIQRRPHQQHSFEIIIEDGGEA